MINKIQGYTANLVQQNRNKSNQFQPSFGSVWQGKKTEIQELESLIKRIEDGRINRKFLTTLFGLGGNGLYNAIEKLGIPLDKMFDARPIFQYNLPLHNAFITPSQARCLIEPNGERSFIRPIYLCNDIRDSRDHWKPVGFTISDGKDYQASYINDRTKDDELQQLYNKMFKLIHQIDYKFT